MRERIKVDKSKKILDVTCGARSIWFDKHNPAAVYCDKRRVHYEGTFGTDASTRTIDVSPDIQCDFTDLPFENETFSLVVWDPPHIRSNNEDIWLLKAYGHLDDDWERVLHDGFRECMRVLKPDGILIFKWAENSIPAADLWELFGEEPLFGHRSGKKSNTFWACFMKSDTWQLGLNEFIEM